MAADAAAFASQWGVQRAADYIRKHGFQRVTLQFPDDLLHDAPLVADALQQLVAHLGARVYVLADTTYNPLGVDEVAAQHVDADCVVHYGYASLYPVSRLPALCILPQAPLDVAVAAQWLARQLQAAASAPAPAAVPADADAPTATGCSTAVILADQAYHHLLPALESAVRQAYAQGPLGLVFAQPASPELWPGPAPGAAAGPQHREPPPAGAASPTTCRSGAPRPLGGLVWPWASPDSSSGSCGAGAVTPPPAGGSAASDPAPAPAAALLVWVGPRADAPALMELQLTHSSRPWLLLDPATQQVRQGLSPDLQRLLKKRYFLVERAKGAQLVGLLVGTLGAAGYLETLQQLQQLVRQAGKRSYTLLMGKPSPAKLANFPEIEVFVMVAEPQGLVLDCKEYLAPIITPFEACLAFTGRSLVPAEYRLDSLAALAQQQQQQQQQQLQQQQQPSGRRPEDANAAAAYAGNVRDEEDEVAWASSSAQQQEPGLAVGLSALALAAHRGGGSVVCGGAVVARTAAEYLTQHRSFQGVETPATGAQLKDAGPVVAGRTGRAAGYDDEPATCS